VGFHDPVSALASIYGLGFIRRTCGAVNPPLTLRLVRADSRDGGYVHLKMKEEQGRADVRQGHLNANL
jgi:hypothetical protein